MKKIIYPTLLWFFVFTASYVALSATELVPVEFSDINNRIGTFFTFQQEASGESAPSDIVENPAGGDSPDEDFKEIVLPERVVIEKISVNVPVINPETRDIAVLDKALLSGVVRFPGSGGLDDESNMFLFGHSTSIQNVRNTAFQAFNRLGELQIGDTIKVRSGGTEYRYKVIAVSQVNKDEALVEFSSGEKLLTLSTCDTFGERSDRFVVTARFIQAVPALGSIY